MDLPSADSFKSTLLPRMHREFPSCKAANSLFRNMLCNSAATNVHLQDARLAIAEVQPGNSGSKNQSIP